MKKLLLLFSIAVFFIGCESTSQEITSVPNTHIFSNGNSNRDTEPDVKIYIKARGESYMPFPGEAFLYFSENGYSGWELADDITWNTYDTPYLWNGFTGCYLKWQGRQTGQTYPPNAWEDNTELYQDYAPADEWYVGYCVFEYR